MEHPIDPFALIEITVFLSLDERIRRRSTNQIARLTLNHSDCIFRVRPKENPPVSFEEGDDRTSHYIAELCGTFLSEFPDAALLSREERFGNTGLSYPATPTLE
jgi:hypothetical protein